MIEEKWLCCDCRATFEAKEATSQSVCPACRADDKVQDRLSELKLNMASCTDKLDNSGENTKRLENLMCNIDKVIDLSRQYTTEGLVSSSMEKFIAICNQVKVKLGGHIDSATVCNACKKTLINTDNKDDVNLPAASSKNVSQIGPPENLPSSGSTYNISGYTSDKVGYFEKKFKEIIKVTRHQNEDGSISEEKQVITIRTEIQKPNQAKDLNEGLDKTENDFGASDIKRKNLAEGTSVLCSCKLGADETKTKQAAGSRLTSELKSQTSVFTEQPKECINRGKRTNFDANTLRNESKSSKMTLSSCYDMSKTSSFASMKVSKNSSEGSLVCCPKKSSSANESLLSRNAVQIGIPISERDCLSTTSVNTNKSIKKSCCSACCSSDMKSSKIKTIKKSTISTNALWRDVGTSTTDLISSPNKKPKVKIRNPKVQKDANEDCPKTKDEESRVKESRSYCTVKIISKPAKFCLRQEIDKVKLDPQQLVLSILDAIMKTYIPSDPDVKDSLRLELTRKNKVNDICKVCTTKRDDTSLLLTSKNSPKECEAKSEEEQVFVASKKLYEPSNSLMSCKSIGVGLQESDLEENHVCKKKTIPSIDIMKQACCLATKNSYESSNETSCQLVETIPKSICCSPKRSGSASCTAKNQVASVKSTSPSLTTRDVGTSTKRSTRFDVRHLRRHTSKSIKVNNCTCHSDSCIFINKDQQELKRRSRSDDGECFKW